METLNATLDKILDEQVETGSFKSREEVTQELLHLLIEKDIDKNVLKGASQIENGEGIEVNKEYKESLQNRILSRLSLNQA